MTALLAAHYITAVAAALIVAGTVHAATTRIGTVQVYDFKASIKNSNVGTRTDRKTNMLYDYKYSEMNILAGYLVVPECTDCGYGIGYSTLYVYRLGDCNRRLYRVPVALNLVDVFATRADINGLVLGNEIEAFLFINSGLDTIKGGSIDVIFDPPIVKGMTGFFNGSAGGSLAPYIDIGNTKFWAAGFGRVNKGKGYWETIPSQDPCLPPIEVWIPGCMAIESLCGQIVGAMEYDYICATPYMVLCASLVECALDTHNAVASGAWQIRRNARLESTDSNDAEQKVLAKLSNYTPFNWIPNGTFD